MLACIPARPAELVARVARIDQLALVGSAERHGASLLVSAALDRAGVQLEPGPAARLSAAARAQLGQGHRMKRLAATTVRALGAEGLRPVLLKGASLAERLYPEQPFARPSSDVDVLVEERELPAARRAMRTLGLAEQADVSLGDVLEDHHHLSFSRAGELVEVHFRLFYGLGGNVFDDAAVRSRLRPSEFGSTQVRLLSPEDEFIYLANHAANHGFLRATWLVDLQRYITSNPGLDWPEMARRASEAGFRSSVAASLWLLESALEVSLPSAARAAFPVGLARTLGHRLLLSPGQMDRASLAAHRLGGSMLRLWLVDSPRDALRHATDGALRLVRRWRSLVR